MKLIRFFLFIVSCFLSFTLYAATPAEELAQLLGQYHSLTAEFKQAVYDGHGKALQNSRGVLSLLRPDHLRWDTRTPNQQLLITDGVTLWIYDVDLEQVDIKPLEKAFGNQPTMLLTSSATEIQQHYMVSILPASAKQREFQLAPKNPDSDFQWVRFYFTDQQISKMQLQDKIGQLTEMTFSHIKANPVLPKSLFHFTPPKGVDIIREKP